MKNLNTQKWLKKAISLIAISGMFAFSIPFSALAFASSVPDLAITDDTVTDSKQVSFCLNAKALVSVGIAEAKANENTTVAMLAEDEVLQAGCYSYSWDQSPTSGNYYYWIEGISFQYVFDGGDGNYYQWMVKPGEIQPDNTVTKTGWIYQASGQTSTSSQTASTSSTSAASEEDIIEDLEVYPKDYDPYEDSDLEITFGLTKDAEVDVKIYDEDTNQLITTLESNEDLDDDEYEYEWDGEDKDGDLVDDGEYYVKVSAETKTGLKDIDKKSFDVEEGSSNNTEEPRLRDVFVTKESFDATRGEKTSIVFTTTSKADIEVSIFDEDNDEIIRLYDKNDQKAGVYTVEWDGEDEKGKMAQEDKEYTYKILIENNNGKDTETGDITLEDDEEWTKLPNIAKDSPLPAAFTPKDSGDKMSFTFKLSKDADVSILVYDNGNVAAHVFDGDLDEGTNTIKWDGTNNFGELLTDGVYDYKIVAENYSGTSKEWGKFMIDDSFKYNYSKKVAGFVDVTADSEYSDAIKWAQENEIFEGYNDGSFQPEQPITRVEALKAIFLTLDVNILEDTGSTLGFTDVYGGAWYMKYIRTAKMYGVVHGYPDGSFKPNSQVAKAEAVVMLLNAAEATSDLIVPSCNTKPYADIYVNDWNTDAASFDKYYDLTESDGYYYYPEQLFTRGEMAELLYNFYDAGLTD